MVETLYPCKRAVRQILRSRQTETELRHVAKYSFDPLESLGNIREFHQRGSSPDRCRRSASGPNRGTRPGRLFYPFATTEGALVASYNRGMRLLTECGGVKTTVVEQFMQRSPVFIFEDTQ